MKIGDPVMRVFERGENWIGVITWISLEYSTVQVKWTHQINDEVHHISILTPVKKCP